MTGYCVCVPARNEAARLPVLLAALAAQTVAGRIAVALCINSSDDDSVAVAEAVAAQYSDRLDVRIDACRFAPADAHAGTARARAMAAGLARVEGHGILISTDADCRPPETWIAANLAAIAGGADIVGGRIVLDDAEPLDPGLLAMQVRFDAYWAAVRAIEDAADPIPHDPPPRHGDHTGASLAIDAEWYATVGGVPAIPIGEDRALVLAAAAAGARLVHPPAVWTRVSARTDGRATGGMAAVMADRATALERRAEPRVPAFAHWHHRAAWRRTTRAQHGTAAMLAQEEALPPMPLDQILPALAR